MKPSREFILWTFFLAICFWAGYLKGLLPFTFKQSLFTRGPVRILNATPFNLPPPFIKFLEQDLGQKVEVQRVRDWDDLQAKLVTKTGPHLVLAPSYWAQDLERENLLAKLNPLQKKMEERIASDFISFQGKNLTVLPLYWTVTDFRVHQESPLDATLEQALAQKSLSEIHLYPDQDLMVTHLDAWAKNPAVGVLKLKDINSFRFSRIPSEFSKTSIWEVPHLLETPQTRTLTTTQSRALLIYGLMIPKNSSHMELSYQLMEKMMAPGLVELVLAKLPLGCTLQDAEEDFKIKKEQRPSELRDLKLHELIIMEKRRPVLFQEYWQKYNFISPN